MKLLALRIKKCVANVTLTAEKRFFFRFRFVKEDPACQALPHPLSIYHKVKNSIKKIQFKSEKSDFLRKI